MQLPVKTTIQNATIILFAIISILHFQSCKGVNNTDEVRESYIISDSLLKTIHIDTVKQGQLVNSITLTGQVDFNQNNLLNIYPMISGAIQDVKVVVGDYVKEVQVLGVIKSSEMAQFSSQL